MAKDFMGTWYSDFAGTLFPHAFPQRWRGSHELYTFGTLAFPGLDACIMEGVSMTKEQAASLDVRRDEEPHAYGTEKTRAWVGYLHL